MDELIGTRSHATATLRLNLCKAIPQGPMRDQTRELTHLEVPIADRRQGFASRLLASVCTEADHDKKTLLVFVQPFGDFDLSKTQLRDWYAKFGFVTIQEDPCLMARLPMQRALNPIQHAIETMH